MAYQSPYAQIELRATLLRLTTSGGLPPEARRAKGGGAAGFCPRVQSVYSESRLLS